MAGAPVRKVDRRVPFEELTVKYACFTCGGQSPVRPLYCPYCRSYGTFGPIVVRQEPAPTAASFISSAVLAARAMSEPRQVPEGWEKLFGSWDNSPTSILLHGFKGMGKTTVAVAAGHRIYESCLFISGEERDGATMSRRLARLELVSPDFILYTGQDLATALAVAEKNESEAIMVDSIEIVPIVRPDIPAILARGHSLWIIAHELKEGGYRGPGWVGHEVDIVARALGVDGDMATLEVEKSRWGAIGRFSVAL